MTWRLKDGREFSAEEVSDMVFSGSVEATCTNEACGYFATVEPDGDYECYECNEGRLISPLIELELM